MEKRVLAVLVAASFISISVADEIEVPNAVAVNARYMANQAIRGDGINGTALVSLTGGTALKTAGGFNSEGVLVFKLPELPIGQKISTAKLTVMSQRSWETAWNIDLYAIRSSASSPAVKMDDYGAYGDSAAGVKIVDNWLTPSDANIAWISRSNDDVAGAVLASWLMDQYTAVGAGGYVFLRFQPDSASAIGDNNAYNVAGAMSTTQAVPVLLIKTAQ